VDELDEVFKTSATETQIRAPAAGSVTVQNSAGGSFATFDGDNDSVTLTGALIVDGKNLKPAIDTLEARVSGAGNFNYLRSPNATGQVGIANSSGTGIMYYMEAFNNVIQTSKQQFRNDFQMTKHDGTVQTYARGVADTKTFEITSGGTQDVLSGALLQVSSGGTFRGEGDFKLTKRTPQPDPTPDILEDFVTSDAANKQLTVLDGGTLQVDGGATALFKATATVDVDAEFNLRQTGTNYLQWTPWNQTLTVLTGATVTVDTGATLTVTGTKVKDAFESSMRRGYAEVDTDGASTSYPYGGGFQRFIFPNLPMATVGQDPLPTTPRVYVSVENNWPNIKHVCAHNVTATKFDLIIDDFDPPTLAIRVNWLAIL
jgi:hypothetical protein